MNVTAERMPDSQVRLTIQVDPDRVEKSMDQAYRRVLPRVRVPGFRPGKAPRRVLERHVGREALLQEALDRLVPEIVDEAIRSQELQIIDQPDLEVTSLDPVVITATVPVRPTVDLGPYRDLRLEPEPVTLDEAKVDEALEELRKRYANIEPVDRPVQAGDHVRFSLVGTADGEEIVSLEDEERTAKAEEFAATPGVYEQIVGVSAGETREFAATLPDETDQADVEDIEDAGAADAAAPTAAAETGAGDAGADAAATAGTPVHYRLTVHDVKAEVLPDLDDDFAREVGEGFPSLEALRERIRDDIRTRGEEEATRKLQEQAVERLVEGATLEYPPQMVERELDHLVDDMARQMGGNDRRAVERYVQLMGRGQANLREQFRSAAADRVKRSLVLSHLAQAERIDVSEADVEAELSHMVDSSTQAAQIRQLFDTPSGRQIIEDNLRSRRTMDRLMQIIRGEAPPPLSEPAEGETPAETFEGEGVDGGAAPDVQQASPGMTAPETFEAVDADAGADSQPAWVDAGAIGIPAHAPAGGAQTVLDSPVHADNQEGDSSAG